MRRFACVTLALVFGGAASALGAEPVRLDGRQDSSRAAAQSADASKVPVLPEPTGAYRIGTSIFRAIDASRPDALAPSPGRSREVEFQIWYPVDFATNGPTALYVPNASVLRALVDEKHDFQEPSVFARWNEIRTDAALDAPLSAKHPTYPTLFFSHGLGEPRAIYTALARDLASHGYLVVCLDHPYGGVTALADGRVVTTGDDPEAGDAAATAKQTEAWARDASFVLDVMIGGKGNAPAGLARIGAHVDPDRIGMLGHSLGGAAALEACRLDQRFKAAADLDGAPFGPVTEVGLKRPTLVMRSGPIYSDADLAKRGRTRAQWEEMGRQGREMWGSLFAKSRTVPVYSVKIDGSGHMSFSDAPFVMPDTITRFGGRIIDAKLGYQIMRRYVLDFFDEYLSGRPSELLDGTRRAYPEVTVERYVPKG